MDEPLYVKLRDYRAELEERAELEAAQWARYEAELAELEALAPVLEALYR